MSTLAALHDGTRAEWSRLLARWQATREHWRDDVAQSFERGRWQEWEQRGPAFLNALEELVEVANRAIREMR